MNRIHWAQRAIRNFPPISGAFASGPGLDLRRNDVGDACSSRWNIISKTSCSSAKVSQYIRLQSRADVSGLHRRRDLAQISDGHARRQIWAAPFRFGRPARTCSVSPLLMTLFGLLFQELLAVHCRCEPWMVWPPPRLWPAMSALMSRAVPRDAKATAMSVFNGAYVLGLAVGPAAGLLLGHLLGTNLYVFPFTAGVIMVGSACLSRSNPFRPKKARRKQAQRDGGRIAERGDRRFARAPDAGAHDGDSTLCRRSASAFWRRRCRFISTINSASNRAICRACCRFRRCSCLAIAIPLGRLPDKVGQAKSVWISYAMAAVGMLMIAGTSLCLRPTSARFRHRC